MKQIPHLLYDAIQPLNLLDHMDTDFRTNTPAQHKDAQGTPQATLSGPPSESEPAASQLAAGTSVSVTISAAHDNVSGQSALDGAQRVLSHLSMPHVLGLAQGLLRLQQFNGILASENDQVSSNQTGTPDTLTYGV